VSADANVERIVRWYAARVYGRLEGPRRLPYYCDPARVGPFAVDPAQLARGSEAALHQVVVTMAMYQSRRDVDIMALQRTMPRQAAAAMTSPARLRVLVERSRCDQLDDARSFDRGCDVRRNIPAGRATCGHRPRTPCHVKDATLAIGRMGDMGMIPTSAWLHLREAGGAAALLARAADLASTPAGRADAMVAALARLHRIGTKLATMIVSALATPALAPGLTPWWPTLDGNNLVVVDANVARTIEALRPGGPRTYGANVAWVRRRAAKLDLRQLRRDWPQTSPRLVQQAMYWFRSRSNRVAADDPCGRRPRCEACVPTVCPFAA
jgi:hypothetical protein